MVNFGHMFWNAQAIDPIEARGAPETLDFRNRDKDRPVAEPSERGKLTG
jgi:hypothetical protein